MSEPQVVPTPPNAEFREYPSVIRVTESMPTRRIDRAVHLSDATARIIEGAIRANCNSKPQEQAAREVALAVVKYLSEAGLAETTLPAIRHEVQRLEEATAKAKAARAELDALASPAVLDDKARRIVALASSLMDVYSRPFTIPAPRGGVQFNENASVACTVLKSASYGVWAYATDGNAMPPNSSDDDQTSA